MPRKKNNKARRKLWRKVLKYRAEQVARYAHTTRRRKQAAFRHQAELSVSLSQAITARLSGIILPSECVE